MFSRAKWLLGLVGLLVGISSFGCGMSGPLRRHHEQQYSSVPVNSAAPASQAVLTTPSTQSSNDPGGVTPVSVPAIAPPMTAAPAQARVEKTPSASNPNVAPQPFTAASTSQELTTVPGVKPPPSSPVADARLLLRGLHRKAVEHYAAIDSYKARLRRREQVNGKDMPEELIEFNFRKQPWSVHMKWIGPEAQGREVVFVKGHYENKIHTLLAPTDPRFPLGGKVVSLPPDSPLVRSRARHAITDAGIGSIIDRFGQLLDREESGVSRALAYGGVQKRPEYDGPLEMVEQVIAVGEESLLPVGGRRWWFFGSTSGLPVLIITAESNGHPVEYYCFDRLQYPVGLDNDDFDPAKLWKGKR
jgi:hypothetical protein